MQYISFRPDPSNRPETVRTKGTLSSGVLRFSDVWHIVYLFYVEDTNSMDGCVGRTKELAFLNELWEKVPMSCAVCGRRHLGKTALIREFTKDKDHIYISGTQGLRSDNLEEINRALSSFSGKKEKIGRAHV